MSTFPENASVTLVELLRKPTTGKLITSQHREVISQICDEARESGMPIERLVVILKSVLDQTPHNDGGIQTRAEVKERLVAVCIEEYFCDGKAKN